MGVDETFCDPHESSRIRVTPSTGQSEAHTMCAPEPPQLSLWALALADSDTPVAREPSSQTLCALDPEQSILLSDLCQPEVNGMLPRVAAGPPSSWLPVPWLPTASLLSAPWLPASGLPSPSPGILMLGLWLLLLHGPRCSGH